MGTKVVISRTPDKLKTARKSSTGEQIIKNHNVRFSYTFLSRFRNPEYDAGVKTLPLRTCLIHHNSAVLPTSQLLVKTLPKWKTNLYCRHIDYSTGEVVGADIYQTNEFKQSNGRKIARLDAFCSHFQPLYDARRVSLLFYTLTVANQAKMTISGIIDVLKKRLKRRKIKMHGYIWTAEVSQKLHFHYHMVVAIDRIDIAGKVMPDYYKLNDAWGARTQVQFVKKNVKHYMAKYFAKHDARVMHMRSFGSHISKKA